MRKDEKREKANIRTFLFFNLFLFPEPDLLACQIAPGFSPSTALFFGRGRVGRTEMEVEKELK